LTKYNNLKMSILDKVKIGNSVKVNLELSKDRLTKETIDAINVSSLGKISDFRITDGKGIGVVLQLSNGKEQWFFEDEIDLLDENGNVIKKNNDKNIRPDYPFIRSILIKLEECLVLKKNSLLKLAVRERKILKKVEKDFLFRKFDLINTWQGSLLYFFILVLTIFILKRYFFFNVNVIEIQNIENQIINK